MMCVGGTWKGAKDLTGGVAAKELQEGEGVKQWNWGGGERRKAEQGKCGIGDLRKVEQWMWAAGDCWMAERRKWWAETGGRLSRGLELRVCGR